MIKTLLLLGALLGSPMMLNGAENSSEPTSSEVSSSESSEETKALEDKDGNRLAESTSSWVILDTAARSFVRPEHLKEIMTVPDGLGDALEEPAHKLVFPRSLEKRPAGQHTVCYSDVDIIGHTNNARYAVWAMDALEYEVVSERPVRELFINFNKETTPGQVVALSTAKENDDVFWVEGEVDGKQVFIFKLILG